MKSANIRYMPAIDHLRAFAALLIVCYHSVSLISYELIYQQAFSFDHWLKAGNPLEALLIEGHTAVSLFMVLSGFIFTVGSYRSPISYVGFIKNRFLRTYPLFLFFLCLGLAFYPDSFNVRGFLQTIFFGANYPGAITAGKFTSMFWAVAVEWQFYLLFPFLLLVVNKTGPGLLCFGVLLVVLFRAVAASNGGDIHQLSYWTLAGRLDQFIIGILAGVFYRVNFSAGKLWDFLAIAAFISMLGLLMLLNQDGGWPAKQQWRIFFPLAEAIIWGVFVLGYLSLARHIPAAVSRLLAQLGTVSYSMYLVHFVLIDLCITQGFVVNAGQDRPLLSAGLSTLLVVIPATLALSAILYRAVEKPFLDLRTKYKQADN